MSKTKFLDRFADHGLDITDSAYNQAIEHDIHRGNDISDFDIFKHPKLSYNHLEVGLSSKNWYARNAALGHQNINTDQLYRHVNDTSETIRNTIASNPKADERILNKSMDDEYVFTRLAAISNPNATENIILRGVNDNSPIIRKATMKTSNYKKFFPNGHTNNDRRSN